MNHCTIFTPLNQFDSKLLVSHVMDRILINQIRPNPTAVGLFFFGKLVLSFASALPLARQSVSRPRTMRAFRLTRFPLFEHPHPPPQSASVVRPSRKVKSALSLIQLKVNACGRNVLRIFRWFATFSCDRNTFLRYEVNLRLREPGREITQPFS